MGAISFKRSSLENFNKYNSLLVGNDASLPFDPASLNPDLWLDASDATTITESGGSVSQWDNKGTLENLSQANSADQPSTGVETINGLNAIRFTTDFLKGSDKTQWKFLHDGTKYFIAGATRFTGGGNVLFSTNRVGSGVGARFHLTRTVSGNFDNALFVDINPNVTFIADDNFYSQDTNLIFSAVFDGTASAANRITYFENETQGSVDNTNSSSPSGSNPDFDFNLANLVDSSEIADDIKLGEFIIVSGADATEENRQLTVNYLNAKWGVF